MLCKWFWYHDFKMQASNNMKRLLTLWMMLGCVGLVAAQQPAGRMGGMPPVMMQQSRVMNEVVVSPAGNQTALTILFRIPYDRIAFVRNRDGADQESFTAAVKVNVEVYKEQRRVTDQTFTAQPKALSFEETRSPLRDVTGELSFQLPAGVYTWRMTIDEQPGLLHQIQIPDFSGTALGRPFPVYGSVKDGWSPENIGGSTTYGTRTTMGVFLALNEAYQTGQLTWKLQKLPRKAIERTQQRMERPNRGGLMRSEQGEMKEMPPMPDWNAMPPPPDAMTLQEGVVTAVQEAGFPQIKARDLGLQSGNPYFATIPLGDRALADGQYVLTLHLKQGTTDQTVHYRFGTYWRNMPNALLNLDFALESLKFICPKDELRELKKGNPEAREAKFRTWWKAKDPTPDTEFNELMAEYYSRVDYASQHFGTASPADALQSDRAKIYITNGPPKSTERVLPDRGGVQEVWTYSDGRQFVFEAASSLDPLMLIK